MFCFRLSSATNCVLPRDTWNELKSDVQMVVICAGIEGAWEILSCKMRLVSTSARFGVA